ncbi:hypothetical protein ACE939_12950 [Aquimarina sp. W85]|uniref:hypothetical protein n=1 Tax=Aquimarina rhodophyticola TaxID=3342246 RepID=UPI00366C242B
MTLGLIVIAYTSYAMNTSEELTVAKEANIETVEEDDVCTRINRYFDEHGVLVRIEEVPC